MPVQGTVKTIIPRCWRWLWNCCLRPQATVLKSSPAPRVNRFDCSLNRHEITVYCYWKQNGRVIQSCDCGNNNYAKDYCIRHLRCCWHYQEADMKQNHWSNTNVCHLFRKKLCWFGQDVYYIDLDIVYSQMLLFVLLSGHLNFVVLLVNFFLWITITC
jgi:hypothetical protein